MDRPGSQSPVITDVMQRDVQALSLEQPLLQRETFDEALSELPQAVGHFGVWTARRRTAARIVLASTDRYRRHKIRTHTA
jgi:hypothetical protein